MAEGIQNKKVGESDYLFELDNGLRVIFSQTKKSAIVQCGIMVGAGSRCETAETNGAAHFIEHGLFKGTTKRKSYHILNRIESVGGELNAFTTRERTCFYTVSLKKYLDRSIDLLTDLVFNPTFPNAEIEKEKSVITEEIEMYEDSPEESIFDEFNQSSFPGSSLGHNILGSKNSIQGFNRDLLVKFWKQHYTTNNIVISIVGSMGPNRIAQIIEKHFVGLPSTSNVKKDAEDVKYSVFEKEISKDFNQVHCIIVNKAFSINSSKKYALTILNNVLDGDWMSSRLNMSVREKHAYAYHVSSGYSAYKDTGTYSVQLGTDEKYLHKSVDLINKEFAKLRDVKLTVIQLNRAKRQLLSQMAMYNENYSSLMQIRGKNLLDFGRIIPHAEIIENIQKVSAADVLEVANDVLDKSTLSTLVYRSKRNR